MVLPSRSEAKTLTGKDDPAQAARSLLEMGPDVAVIKMGPKGALAVTQTETVFEPAFRVPEVDPTGAGDVYDAAFVYGMLKDWSLEKTMELASAVGAIEVTRIGPMSGLFSLKQVKEFTRKTVKKMNPDKNC